MREKIAEIALQLYGNQEPCDSCLERGGCTKTPIRCATDRLEALFTAETAEYDALVHRLQDRTKEALAETQQMREALEAIMKETENEMTPCTNRVYRIAFKALKGRK